MYKHAIQTSLETVGLMVIDKTLKWTSESWLRPYRKCANNFRANFLFLKAYDHIYK